MVNVNVYSNNRFLRLNYMKIIEGRFTGFYQSDFGNFLQMQIGRQNPSIGYNL